MSLYTGSKNVGSRFLAAKGEYKPPAYAMFNYQKILQDAYRQQQWTALGDERKSFNEMKKQRLSNKGRMDVADVGYKGKIDAANIKAQPGGPNEQVGVTKLSRSKIIGALKNKVFKYWTGYDYITQDVKTREQGEEFLNSQGYLNFSQDASIMRELEKLPTSKGKNAEEEYNKIKSENPKWKDEQIIDELIKKGY